MSKINLEKIIKNELKEFEPQNSIPDWDIFENPRKL